MSKSLFLFLVSLAVLVAVACPVSAQDSSTGSWDWKGQEPNGESRVQGLPGNRPSFGIAGNPTNVRMMIEGAMRTIPGELVKLITQGSVAEKAGLRRGDVIVKWDGKYVGHDGELPQLIQNSRGSGPFQMKIVRNGSFRTLEAHFGQVRSVNRLQGSERRPSASNRAEVSAPVGAVMPEPTLPSAPKREQEIDAEIEDILGD
jgi:membrane-associated protease RseP (regulator of RpoE activity)